MESETAEEVLQEVYIFTNPNRSLKLLVTFDPFQKLAIVSFSSFEHSTSAAKNGSLRKLSPENCFFPAGEFDSFRPDFLGVPAGGSGRKWLWWWSFLLGIWCLGIPGSFSHENGIPENRRGVAGEELEEEEEEE